MKTIIYTSIVVFFLFSMKTEAQNYPSAAERNGLPTGEKAPMFQAVDKDKRVFSLQDTLKIRPVVLIFYRGVRCPVCSKHLNDLQDSLKLIEAKGAKVVAVSPQKPEYLDSMAQKTGAHFSLLYDEDYAIADAYKVSFKPNKSTLLMYNTMLNANLKKTQSDDSQRLPIPATYIISREGQIIWRHFNPDYKARSSVKEILEQL